jgi:large subunit ribosomal protein L21
MYAIVEVGGRQYRVSPGEKFLVEKLAQVAGSTVELPVLLLSDETGVSVGKPFVDGKKLSVKVIGEAKGEKLIAFKYQPKKRYRKKTGHRQTYTVLQVEGGAEPAPAKVVITEAQPVENAPATEPAAAA